MAILGYGVVVLWDTTLLPLGSSCFFDSMSTRETIVVIPFSYRVAASPEPAAFPMNRASSIWAMEDIVVSHMMSKCWKILRIRPR